LQAKQKVSLYEYRLLSFSRTNIVAISRIHKKKTQLSLHKMQAKPSSFIHKKKGKLNLQLGSERFHFTKSFRSFDIQGKVHFENKAFALEKMHLLRIRFMSEV